MNHQAVMRTATAPAQSNEASASGCAEGMRCRFTLNAPKTAAESKGGAMKSTASW